MLKSPVKFENLDCLVLSDKISVILKSATCSENSDCKSSHKTSVLLKSDTPLKVQAGNQGKSLLTKH